MAWPSFYDGLGNFYPISEKERDALEATPDYIADDGYEFTLKWKRRPDVIAGYASMGFF